MVSLKSKLVSYAYSVADFNAARMVVKGLEAASDRIPEHEWDDLFKVETIQVIDEGAKQLATLAGLELKTDVIEYLVITYQHSKPIPSVKRMMELVDSTADPRMVARHMYPFLKGENYALEMMLQFNNMIAEELSLRDELGGDDD